LLKLGSVNPEVLHWLGIELKRSSESFVLDEISGNSEIDSPHVLNKQGEAMRSECGHVKLNCLDPKKMSSEECLKVSKNTLGRLHFWEGYNFETVTILGQFWDGYNFGKVALWECYTFGKVTLLGRLQFCDGYTFGKVALWDGYTFGKVTLWEGYTFGNVTLLGRLEEGPTLKSQLSP